MGPNSLPHRHARIPAQDTSTDRNRKGRTTGRARAIGAICIAAGFLALFGARPSQAATPAAATKSPSASGDVPRAIAEFVQAGEFGPALALARRIEAAGTRDRGLQLIAAAQAQVGAQSASYNTAAEITSDLVRSQSIRDAAEQPFAGAARGGGAQPDFQSLIQLITTTINPPSWDENGGQGAVMPFFSGVRVDAQGVMHRVLAKDASGRLESLRREAAHERVAAEVRRSSALRKISLPRLEREIQVRLAEGHPLDEDMLVLAGLQRIKYVLVYPETGDLVLAGPAGDWKSDRENRYVSIETGRPLVRLDDFVVVWRQMNSAANAQFGCSITPTTEALAKAQAFIDQGKGQPLKPGQRGEWLQQLRAQLGQQKVEFAGIDPHTRVAQVILEADYRMKLVGIGLEEGTLGVPSYLAMLHVPAGQSPPPLGVLRWWFTMDYQALTASPERDVFEIRGQGVRVQSENELLKADGQRVHTGQADDLNQEFARCFTKEFAALSEKYPIYAELQNVFDLALACAAIKSEGLLEKVDWHATCFNDPVEFPVSAGNVPESVDTVINHRVINRIHVVAAVSGGVQANPWQWAKPAAIATERRGSLNSERVRSTPHAVPRRGWWWD